VLHFKPETIIVNDVRDSARYAPTNHIYAAPSWYPPVATTFYVRITGSDFGAMTGLLRHTLDRYDPRIVVAYAAPITEAIGWQSNPEKLVHTTLNVLSGLALALTVSGLFAVLAYSVERRMPEFGVRQVLGATGLGLAKLVVQSSLRMVVLGIGIGVLGAIALSAYCRSLLFETRPYDPRVLGGVGVALVAVALVSSLIPAWRAAHARVSELLRAE
jgi:ABC-type antimicrobial peptide transport system permease subunit